MEILQAVDGPWYFLDDFDYCISEVEREGKKKVTERKERERMSGIRKSSETVPALHS